MDAVGTSFQSVIAGHHLLTGNHTYQHKHRGPKKMSRQISIVNRTKNIRNFCCYSTDRTGTTIIINRSKRSIDRR